MTVSLPDPVGSKKLELYPFPFSRSSLFAFVHYIPVAWSRMIRHWTKCLILLLLPPLLLRQLCTPMKAMIDPMSGPMLGPVLGPVLGPMLGQVEFRASGIS